MNHSPETSSHSEGGHEMTREKAVEFVLAHLQFAKETLESQDIPTQNLDEAIQSLQAGDPKPAINILLDEVHHNRSIEVHPLGDGSGPTESDRDLAGKESDAIAQWIEALEK